MAEHSDNDTQRARQIVSQIFSDQGVSEIGNNIVISDLERDVGNFVNDLRMLEDFNSPMPALRVGGELVPMSLSSVIEPRLFSNSLRGRWWATPSYDHVHNLMRTLQESVGKPTGIETISPEVARSAFTKRATNFLASRIAGVRYLNRRDPVTPPPPILNILQRSGGPRIPTPGCQFSVSSNSSGLRVFWSPAYVIASNYFGHPTSPTKSVLQSGDYLFGVNGGAYGDQVQWDENAIVTLPGQPQVHLNY